MGYPISSSDEEKDWKAESDLSTLMEAERIKRDKPRYERAMKCAKKKAGDLKSVVGEAAITEKSGNPMRGED
jgi:hypothetical protein